ncbi:hypothetical protein GYMLUDRAFT_177281 [Collybiopsis luxurians FD-317 M1]|uniref:EKC/KEOPS complex subunit CGI121 n=1 Tax=Collybiopsis luxurians FD-317 M1 TaxID=944289 RepID=A0A0D0C8S2_9AGAR|nr:hypothetical protein GYMLUDRAFT_177281 [Collybiopsis luxurians FD-317 M1]
METFQFNHDHNVAYALLFSPVRDPGNIKQRIVAAATMSGPEGDEERDAVDFAFIEPTLVTSRLHLETAIHQAIIAESQGSLRTKTIHSEILFALNPTNNITEAIRRFGVSESSKSLLVVHITNASPSLEVESKMRKAVDGTVVPFSELNTLTDWDRVKKYHKLDKEVKEKENGGSDQSAIQAFIDKVAISSVAMKSVMQ